MRSILAIFFLLSAYSAYSQEWHLDEIDKKATYKYNYSYRFKHVKDTSIYTLVKMKGSLQSTILVQDKLGERLPYTSVRFRNLKNDSLIPANTNIDGEVFITLGSGNYKIEIVYAGYEKLSLEVTIAESESLNLNAKLGQPSPKRYARTCVREATIDYTCCPVTPENIKEEAITQLDS